MNRILLYLACFIFCFNSEIRSESISDSAKAEIEKKITRIDSISNFSFHTSVLSKISYAGRYYDISGIAICPTVSYKQKYGFNASLANNIWTGFSPIFNQSTISLGYAKNLKSWLGAGISYSRLLMFYGTDSDKKMMNNALNFNLGFYTSWLNIGIDYSYMFGYDKASMLMVDANKDFVFYSFLKSDKFSIAPSIKMYFGTQTAYYSYISKQIVQKTNNEKALKAKGKGNGVKGTTTTTTTEVATAESTNFEALDIQCSLPLNYRIGHFDFELSYNIDFPLNLPTDYTYGNKPFSTLSGYIKYIF